jgi:radical SAM superfamily enzyme YgiQ (UPF0313 family)
MYRDKTFSEKPIENILSEIATAAQSQTETRRVFLADGDALYRDMDSLLLILGTLYQYFPKLGRVSSYALPNNLLTKSVDDLKQLKEAGLTLIYYGIESGDATLLKCITKGATPEKMRQGLMKASDAGLKISATVILGLGGRKHWREHIEHTAQLVNQLGLTYLSTLQLTLEENIYEEFMDKFARQHDRFEAQDDLAILQELALLISLVNPKKPLILRSNHASNALPLKGNLPRDKTQLLEKLNMAVEGGSELIPPWLRSL